MSLSLISMEIKHSNIGHPDSRYAARVSKQCSWDFVQRMVIVHVLA